jgi:hypothetical protein
MYLIISEDSSQYRPTPLPITVLQVMNPQDESVFFVGPRIYTIHHPSIAYIPADLQIRSGKGIYEISRTSPAILCSRASFDPLVDGPKLDDLYIYYYAERERLLIAHQTAYRQFQQGLKAALTVEFPQ